MRYEYNGRICTIAAQNYSLVIDTEKAIAGVVIGGAQFVSFKPSYTATRHMMGATGVYANYSGTLADGTAVGGRIQYASIDGTLYGLEIVFPEGFRGDFIDVFGQIRSSMKLIK